MSGLLSTLVLGATSLGGAFWGSEPEPTPAEVELRDVLSALDDAEIPMGDLSFECRSLGSGRTQLLSDWLRAAPGAGRDVQLSCTDDALGHDCVLEVAGRGGSGRKAQVELTVDEAGTTLVRGAVRCSVER